MVLCTPSCKNSASSDKSSINDITDDNARVEVGTPVNDVKEESKSTPILSVSDLNAVYDHREDTT